MGIEWGLRVVGKGRGKCFASVVVEWIRPRDCLAGDGKADDFEADVLDRCCKAGHSD